MSIIINACLIYTLQPAAKKNNIPDGFNMHFSALVSFEHHNWAWEWNVMHSNEPPFCIPQPILINGLGSHIVYQMQCVLSNMT